MNGLQVHTNNMWRANASYLLAVVVFTPVLAVVMLLMADVMESWLSQEAAVLVIAGLMIYSLIRQWVLAESYIQGHRTDLRGDLRHENLIAISDVGLQTGLLMIFTTAAHMLWSAEEQIQVIKFWYFVSFVGLPLFWAKRFYWSDLHRTVKRPVLNPFANR